MASSADSLRATKASRAIRTSTSRHNDDEQCVAQEHLTFTESLDQNNQTIHTYISACESIVSSILFRLFCDGGEACADDKESEQAATYRILSSQRDAISRLRDLEEQLLRLQGKL